jgi:DNA-binding NarL/FixJ family response regulator
MSDQDNRPRKKVLIVDDHQIMRFGLSQLIQEEPDLMVCGEAESPSAALKAVAQTDPDVVIVDISLKDGNGIELIKDIKVRWPDLPILVLSMHEESFYAERVLRAGARGYVTKAEVSARVIEGIRKVLDDGVYVSETIASKMLRKLVGRTSSIDTFPVDRLSDREFQVFELIGQGSQTRQIAERLHLSLRTVEAHREHIKGKLNLESATDLLTYAVQWYQFERGS